VSVRDELDELPFPELSEKEISLNLGFIFAGALLTSLLPGPGGFLGLTGTKLTSFRNIINPRGWIGVLGNDGGVGGGVILEFEFDLGRSSSSSVSGSDEGDVETVELDPKDEHRPSVLDAFEEVEENEDVDDDVNDEYDDEEDEDEEEEDGIGFEPNGSGFELPAAVRIGVDGAVGAKAGFWGDEGTGLGGGPVVDIDWDVSSNK